jgi:hypothetical protein
MKTLATLLVLALACATCTRDRRSSEAKPGADAGRAAEEACVDAWISKNHLDPYGSPEGTMYAGGTPLFDEATGERTDRLEYLYAHHPDVKRACSPGGQ